MKINLYEFFALSSLLAVGYAAGWCFKGLWRKAKDERLAEKYSDITDQWEDHE